MLSSCPALHQLDEVAVAIDSISEDERVTAEDQVHAVALRFNGREFIVRKAESIERCDALAAPRELSDAQGSP
jgi:predicted HAD superfamily phosphohydrolase